jgi:hypothetical protein
MTEILGRLNEMRTPGSGWNGSRKISPSVDDEVRKHSKPQIYLLRTPAREQPLKDEIAES